MSEDKLDKHVRNVGRSALIGCVLILGGGIALIVSLFQLLFTDLGINKGWLHILIGLGLPTLMISVGYAFIPKHPKI